VGFSVGGDLAFLREHMPKLAAFFDRKVIDLNAISQLAKRWRPDLYRSSPKGPGTHRAWPDALHSLEVLRHYQRAELFRKYERGPSFGGRDVAGLDTDPDHYRSQP
jgi:oligoribonuclease (3'-5' exoribonuclease)